MSWCMSDGGHVEEQPWYVPPGAERAYQHTRVGSVGPREAGLRAALLEAIEELEDVSMYIAADYDFKHRDAMEAADRLRAVLENV